MKYSFHVILSDDSQVAKFATRQAFADMLHEKLPDVTSSLVVEEIGSRSQKRHFHAVVYLKNRHTNERVSQKLSEYKALVKSDRTRKEYIEYLLIPSVTKTNLDDSPLFSPNFSFPQGLEAKYNNRSKVASDGRIRIGQLPYLLKKRNLTTPKEFMDAASAALSEGDFSMSSFVMSRQSKLTDDIEYANKMNKTNVLPPPPIDRHSLVRQHLNLECSDDGETLKRTISVLINNRQHPARFGHLVMRALKYGAKKYTNVFLCGPGSSGKSSILKGLKKIFNFMTKPSPGTGHLASIRDYDILIFDDLELPIPPTDYQAWLNLFGGEDPTISVPKNQPGAKDFILYNCPPVFATNMEEPNHKLMERAIMMNQRFSHIQFFRRLDKSDPFHDPCSHCYARYLVSAWEYGLLAPDYSSEQSVAEFCSTLDVRLEPLDLDLSHDGIDEQYLFPNYEARRSRLLDANDCVPSFLDFKSVGLCIQIQNLSSQSVLLPSSPDKRPLDDVVEPITEVEEVLESRPEYISESDWLTLTTPIQAKDIPIQMFSSRPPFISARAWHRSAKKRRV